MIFETIFGEKIETTCAGCVVKDNNKFKEGRIYQTDLWDISQDFEIAYPGLVVISPIRHVSNYADLTSKEVTELRKLTIYSQTALKEIYDCDKMCHIFYEKPNGHIHFIIIPLHGLVEIEDKYAVLGELMKKQHKLLTDKENMQRVVDTIEKLKYWFNEKVR